MKMYHTILKFLPVTFLAIVCILFGQRVHGQTVDSEKCATGIHAVVSRGQGSGDDLDVMGTLTDLILQQIPGSTVLGLPYDHGAKDKFKAVSQGALMLQKYVREYADSCPQSKVAVIGYSLGACLTMEAICGTSSLGLTNVDALDPSYNKTIIGTIVYGDETYSPFQSWNVGNCTVGAGYFPRLNSGSCSPFASSIQSYCDYGDDQCCAIYPMDNNQAHHTYMAKYNQKVVDFLKRRLDGTNH
ncbi:hypothetical protein N7492_004966 [Penicillium capsulatum]|uniref:Cutinase n=1 Tax=Penicillium capsulatum TaxID=69766 RepID=A0A9W9LRP1_9EURO|nr:hypothetical protein N7492_004966 [Penicillium capsulatum]KAJ6135926.1 hypothetical protein N7512_001086 [Penicillium capsulatum]